MLALTLAALVMGGSAIHAVAAKGGKDAYSFSKADRSITCPDCSAPSGNVHQS